MAQKTWNDRLIWLAALPPALDWTLHLLGDGPERGRLADTARELGIDGRVRFLGRVPSTQAAQFYRTLDVLVLPSLSRNFRWSPLLPTHLQAATVKALAGENGDGFS